MHNRIQDINIGKIITRKLVFSVALLYIIKKADLLFSVDPFSAACWEAAELPIAEKILEVSDQS